VCGVAAGVDERGGKLSFYVASFKTQANVSRRFTRAQPVELWIATDPRRHIEIKRAQKSSFALTPQMPHSVPLWHSLQGFPLATMRAHMPPAFDVEVMPHGAAASSVPVGASRPLKAFSVHMQLSRRTWCSRRQLAKAGATAQTPHTFSSRSRPREPHVSAAAMPAPVSGPPLAANEWSDSQHNAAARPRSVTSEEAMLDKSRCRKPPCARPISCFSCASVKRAAAAGGSGPMRVQRSGDATASRHARAMHAAAHNEATSPSSGCRMSASASGGSSSHGLGCSIAGTAALCMLAVRVSPRFQALAGT